jgi:putative ABC transport system permease protein
MENLMKDLRYALRMLVKSPGFTLIAILALALGIGANTAIFSIFNGILWRPLPVKDPQQLVAVAQKGAIGDFPVQLSYPDFLDYRELKTAFADLIAYAPTPVNIGAAGRPERAWAEMISGNYFSMLGLEAVRGRLFAADEGWVPGKDPIIVLSYKYWQKRFGGDPGAIGQTVTMNKHAYTIIGVVPQRYRGAYYFLEPDIYLPLTAISLLDPDQADLLKNRGAADFRVLGRLQPGVSVAQALAAAAPTDRRLAKEYPETHKGQSLVVMKELDARPEPGLGGFMKTAMAVFMLLVGLVLLIACANVANLILARANGRRKEMATRTAMGASRWRMVRQLLTESTMLGLLGGIAGLGLARWAAWGLLSIEIPGDLPLKLFDLTMDWSIFGFSCLIATLTGVIAGIIPALQASRTDIAETLKAGGRSGGASTGHHRFRNALVVGQVAVSLLLLACAGFFIRSFQNSAHEDMGFRQDHTLIMSLDLGLQGYKEPRGQQFFKQLSERVKTLPGVREVAVTSHIPMGYDNSFANVYPEGQINTDQVKAEIALTDMVQPAYFQAAGVPVIEGREFTDTDTANAPKVAIVNEALAKKFWPGQDVIGKVFRTSKDGQPVQVVGLTKTGKYMFLYEPPQPFIYFPLEQRYNSVATLVVHTQDDPRGMTGAVREQIRNLDPGLPVYSVTTMEQHVKYGKPLLPARLGAMLVGAFGLLGLALASVGVYGVVSYSVSQRTQEIGIRMSMGAQTGNVLAMVLRQGMTMAGIGTVIGILLAFLLFKGMHTLLYGVKSTDLLTLGSVSALLLGVAFIASYVPALRATHVDPIVALRQE